MMLEMKGLFFQTFSRKQLLFTTFQKRKKMNLMILLVAILISFFQTFLSSQTFPVLYRRVYNAVNP